MVPLIAGDEAGGLFQVRDVCREHAYGEAEVRLLATVAASMGVALESARLFDETQRLLKETEQRNAELAVINSIQQGIAAKLDFQAIVDLVGDKLREVFGKATSGSAVRRARDGTDAFPLQVRARRADRDRLPIRISGKGLRSAVFALANRRHRGHMADVAGRSTALDDTGDAAPQVGDHRAARPGSDRARAHRPREPRARERV